MEATKNINIYIGLKKSDMKTDLNKDEVLTVVTAKLKQINQNAFNYSFIYGVWNGSKEETLKISFLNTDNINLLSIKEATADLKGYFDQECILLEMTKAQYEFI